MYYKGRNKQLYINAKSVRSKMESENVQVEINRGEEEAQKRGTR